MLEIKNVYKTYSSFRKAIMKSATYKNTEIQRAEARRQAAKAKKEAKLAESKK